MCGAGAFLGVRPPFCIGIIGCDEVPVAPRVFISGGRSGCAGIRVGAPTQPAKSLWAVTGCKYTAGLYTAALPIEWLWVKHSKLDKSVPMNGLVLPFNPISTPYTV